MQNSELWFSWRIALNNIAEGFQVLHAQSQVSSLNVHKVVHYIIYCFFYVSREINYK